MEEQNIIINHQRKNKSCIVKKSVLKSTHYWKWNYFSIFLAYVLFVFSNKPIVQLFTGLVVTHSAVLFIILSDIVSLKALQCREHLRCHYTRQPWHTLISTGTSQLVHKL